MSNESKINRREVEAYLDEIEARGEQTPTVRALRSRFNGGSFATLNGIVRQWRQGREQKRQAELEGLSICSRDLEGKLIMALQPILNGRVQEIVRTALKESEAALNRERQSNEELTVQIEQLNQKILRLEQELEKAAQEREKTTAMVANRIEVMAQKCAAEKQQMKEYYEAELRGKEEINRKLDQLLSSVGLPGMPEKGSA